MVTAADLLAFEQEHKLLHPPYNSLEQWAVKINNNDGLCPAGTERKCPCTECLDEMDLKDDNEAACAGWLFCDQRYADVWAKSWEKYARRAKREQERQERLQQEATNTGLEEPHEVMRQSPNAEDWKIKSPMIAKLIDVLRKTKTLLNKKKFDEASELMTEERNHHEGCDACRDYLAAEVFRTQVLKHLNEVDQNAYETELIRAQVMLDFLIDLYTKVDIEWEKEPYIPELDKVGANGEKLNDLNRPYSNPYHSCVGTIIRQLTAEGQGGRAERFTRAAKICKKVTQQSK